MTDNPWNVDLSPERMPEGWRFCYLVRRQNGMFDCLLVRKGALSFTEQAVSGPTPGAALAEAIQKVKDHTDDN